MTHPIYRTPTTSEHLAQGDILDPEPLRANLRGHQDYFVDKPHFYRYMVLTQTCDLDQSRATADYIFLAVVRRLDEALGRRHVDNQDAKNSTRELLQALFNHNYHKRGFFYLPQDANQGVEVDSVADLRVIFSLHKEHYSALLAARCGAITAVYAAQLGHIAGYMFNRVATPGWEELNQGSTLKKHVKGTLASLEERESDRFEALIKQYGKYCSIEGCTFSPNTFRWLRIASDSLSMSHRQCPLCLEHAQQHDKNTIDEGATLRPILRN